jgi:subtilisin family serine protease
MAIVAIVDTGILVNHDDFKGKLWVNEGEVPVKNNGAICKF